MVENTDFQNIQTYDESIETKFHFDVLGSLNKNKLST